MPEAAFHDPPSRRDEAAALALELAKVLVGAPRLPIELSKARLRLLDVRPGGSASIELVLGHEDPIALIRLLPRRASDPVPIGGGPVRVTVTETYDVRPDVRTELDAMASRLGRSTTAERWSAAVELAQALRVVRNDVPLEHYRQRVEGTSDVGLVRVGFGCNQDCGLCWQDRDWPRHPPEQVRTWISDLATSGVRQLIVSGGEPMLDAELPSYLEHARALGLSSITLETNAILAARPGAAERLRAAGLDIAFVSLHSPDAAVSDAITRAPGTHVRTIAGIHALVAAGVDVKLNCVMTAEGLASLPRLPDYVHRELARYGKRIQLMLSYPSDAWDATLVPQIRPDPAALRVALKSTVDRAVALGIELDGLDGPCGPPLCAHGADRRVLELKETREPISFRTFAPGCGRCAVRRACPGVRTGDLEAFGERAIEPIAAWPAAGERAPSPSASET